MVDEWAAADLVIADAVTVDLADFSSVTLVGAVSAAFLPELEPMEEPRALSEYLDGRRLLRGRRERLPMEDSLDMTPSMMGPYDLVVGEPTLRKPCGTGSASSGNDCLAVVDCPSTAERLRSMSPRVIATRRLWASTTSSSVVWDRRGREGTLK
jgi:hypothetical protein